VTVTYRYIVYILTQLPAQYTESISFIYSLRWICDEAIVGLGGLTSCFGVLGRLH